MREPITADLDLVALGYEQHRLVVRPMVGRADGETVPDRRYALGEPVRDDVSGVGRRALPQLAHAAPLLARGERPPAEVGLVGP